MGTSLQLCHAKARRQWVTLACSLLGGFFFPPCYLYVTVAPKNGFVASLATRSRSSVEWGTCSDPTLLALGVQG